MDRLRGVDRELSRPRAEQKSFDPHNVADVGEPAEHLVEKPFGMFVGPQIHLDGSSES